MQRGIVLLAACALAGSTMPSARADAEGPEAGKLTIHGELEGQLPAAPGAKIDWIVELRDESEDRVIAEQRGVLSQRQPPIPFVLFVDAGKLSASHRHTLRGALRQGGQVRWLTEPKPVDPAQAAFDAGSLRLRPFTHPGAFASTLQCGGRRVTIGHIGDQVRLTDGTQVHDLSAVLGSKPPRFERAGEPSTFVQLDEQGATVSLRGQTLPRCVGVAPRR